ncbi:MAG: cytochrome d ubiquinol oxidase subunit II [Opitutales bacterium]
MNEIFQSGDWLPYAFALLIGISFLAYAILDGYDLGVGMLCAFCDNDERDRMIASIGPFWDANETWLVLGVGLLLVAFPPAHGIVLTNLYLPVGLMLIALIFRGVSFDFRKKCPPQRQRFWNRSFVFASTVVALNQGYMVGRFMVGFQESWTAQLFALYFGVLVVAGYILMGASWLIMKTEGALQRRAVKWTRRAIWIMVIGAVLSSLAAVFTDTRIYESMFAFPQVTLLVIMPVASIGLTFLVHFLCGELPLPKDRLAWMPFAISVFIFIFGFVGLVYSFYPYIIPGHLEITDAAAAPESLIIILVGTLIVLPFLIGYTALSYYIFRGKATELSYD